MMVPFRVKQTIKQSMLSGQAYCDRQVAAGATREVSGVSTSLLRIPQMVTSFYWLQQKNMATALFQNGDGEMAELKAS